MPCHFPAGRYANVEASYVQRLQELALRYAIERRKPLQSTGSPTWISKIKYESYRIKIVGIFTI
ncbi:hypothetical protein [Nostoc flagelliforme]|uniref:hypothetical protein n=1 Tax=Nostoc flagelliforme TaxID=1306274 RepID=UPI0012FD2437